MAAMFAAEYETASSDNRRRGSRTPVSFDAHLGRGGTNRTLCKVVDLSRDGAKLQTFTALKRGATIWLTLPEVGRIAAEIMWSSDYAAGCRFRNPLRADVYDRLVTAG